MTSSVRRGGAARSAQDEEGEEVEEAEDDGEENDEDDDGDGQNEEEVEDEPKASTKCKPRTRGDTDGRRPGPMRFPTPRLIMRSQEQLVLDTDRFGL